MVHSPSQVDRHELRAPPLKPPPVHYGLLNRFEGTFQRTASFVVAVFVGNENVVAQACRNQLEIKVSSVMFFFFVFYCYLQNFYLRKFERNKSRVQILKVFFIFFDV